MEGLCDRIEKMLQKNGVFADVWEVFPAIRVEIHRGDWKHEHARAKWLIQEAGGTLISSSVTDDDGSDCYSAIYDFVFFDA